MSNSNDKAAAISVEGCQSIQDFFGQKGLLAKACSEIGFDYNAVRYNLNGPKEKIQLANAVFLTEWQSMWIEQESQRKELAAKYIEMKSGHNNG